MPAWAVGAWAEGAWRGTAWAQEAPEPQPEPEVVWQTPAGRARRRPYVVAVDGQDFIVGSAEEAVALLQRARALAERTVETKARNVERRLRKRQQVPVVELPRPHITVPAELRAELSTLVADIERLYSKASVDMEMRLLFLKQQQDEDDDEEVILLS